MTLTTVLDDSTNQTLLPVVSVYCQLAPIPAPVRGTSVPAAGAEAAVAGSTNVHNTEMGAFTLIDRAWDGSAVTTTDWFQPGVGINKRHGVTRGRPPREHLRA